MVKLAKWALFAGCILAALTLGYLWASLLHGNSFISLYGTVLRPEVAWPLFFVLATPIWIAILRSILVAGLRRASPSFTSNTLLRRWILLHMNGILPENFDSARRLSGRDY